MRKREQDPQEQAWNKVTKEWELDLDHNSFDHGWVMAINWMLKKYGRACKK